MARDPSSPYLRISPVFRTAGQGKALWDKAEQLGRVGAWEWNTRANELVWSDNTFRLFGYEPGEVEPTPERAFERIHPADVDRVRDQHGSVQVGDVPSSLEYRVVRPDGAIRRLYATPVVEEPEPEHTGRRIVGFVQDVTEQHCADHAEATQRAVSSALAMWESFTPGAERLLRELAQALGLEAGAMWVPSAHVLTPRVFWSVPSAEAQALERVLSGLQVPMGVGLPGRAWQSKQPVAPAGPGPGESFLERRANGTGGTYAAIALPAVSDDEVLAVVALYSSEPFTPGERLMRAFADAGLQLGAFLARRRGSLRPSKLTARELEVLRLAAQGLARQEIQARLVLSRSTIKTHFEHIYAKLGVSNRVAAVATALREGLIE
jgi:DNA-binding CsgD family transcriptional regulator